MADYVMAVGTEDPQGFSAPSEAEALRQAVSHVEGRHADILRQSPQTVVTLMGPSGLLTRPSERIDEFIRRQPGPHPMIDAASIQPGDTNAPDCNGD